MQHFVKLSFPSTDTILKATPRAIAHLTMYEMHKSSFDGSQSQKAFSENIQILRKCLLQIFLVNLIVDIVHVEP